MTVFRILTLIWLIINPALAADPGALTGVEVDTARGKLSLRPADPAAVDALVTRLPDFLRPYTQAAGGALARAICLARDQAIDEARPIPPGVRKTLLPYFPAALLDRVRWTVNDLNRLSLDGLMVLNRSVEAMALEDVLVFADCAKAQTRWDVWAHELVHVLQYAAMTTDRFALAYLITTGGDIEKQAYDWQGYVGGRLKSTRLAVPPGACS